MTSASLKPATAALLLAVAGAGAPAHANDYSSLFEQRYSSPEDISVLGNFVAKAVEVGQYDQAISTLEQHLVKYPRDARAKYSLAKVYANTGSWELVKRNAEDALEIGDLTAEEAADAQRLLSRANNSLAGFEWALDATVGIKSTWLDTDQPNLFGSNDGWRDRQDWNPYIASNGSLRMDLDTPLGDALIASGGVLFERRYEDVNQGGFNPFPDFSDGGIYLHNRGYASLVLDKGIETTRLDGLRLQFGVFGNWKSYNPSITDAALGTSIRLIILPTVDTAAYVGGRYSNLSPSRNLAAEHRFEAEAGVTRRLSHEHSVGIAGRYIHELDSAGDQVTEQREVELSYAGLVPHRPFETVWTQQASVAFGDFETAIPAFFSSTEGHYLKAHWTHTFQIDGYNSVSLGYEFRRNDFTAGFFSFDNDFSTHAINVSYTRSF
jgi:tetratricopeptide (TPR) repeat protein